MGMYIDNDFKEEYLREIERETKREKQIHSFVFTNSVSKYNFYSYVTWYIEI